MTNSSKFWFILSPEVCCIYVNFMQSIFCWAIANVRIDQSPGDDILSIAALLYKTEGINIQVRLLDRKGWSLIFDIFICGFYQTCISLGSWLTCNPKTMSYVRSFKIKRNKLFGIVQAKTDILCVIRIWFGNHSRELFNSFWGRIKHL